MSRCLPPLSRLIGAVSLIICTPLLGQSGVQPLTESVVQEVINEVSILTGDDLNAVPAQPNMTFRAPDFLQTGRRSKARLKAEDGTITRIGSNTLFSFDESSRTVNLKRGSLLFHSPEGRGGGRVVTASATASVLGTTIIVAATQDGGFKLLVLEGRAQVAFPDGSLRQLGAGQMTFVRPGTLQGGRTNAPVIGSDDSSSTDDSDSGTNTTATDSGSGGEAPAGEPGPVLNFDLERMTEESGLLGGFSDDLPSIERIEAATQDQIDMISGGELDVTDALIIEVNDDDDLVVAIDRDLTETAREVQEEERETNDNTPPLTTEERFEAALESTIDLAEGFPEENLFGLPGVLVGPDRVTFQEEESLLFGFIAGDLVFPSGPLDLSPIALQQDGASFSEIFIGAFNSLDVPGDLSFTGISSNSLLSISSLGLATIADGATITVNPNASVLWDFGASSFAPLSGVTLQNLDGSVFLSSEEGDISLTDSTITAAGSLPDSFSPFEQDTANFLELESNGNFTVSGSGITSSGSILVSSEGSFSATDTTFSAASIFEGRFSEGYELLESTRVEAEDILLSGTGGTIDSSNFEANGLIAVDLFSNDSEPPEDIVSAEEIAPGLTIDDSSFTASTTTFSLDDDATITDSSFESTGPLSMFVGGELVLDAVVASGSLLNIEAEGALEATGLDFVSTESIRVGARNSAEIDASMIEAPELFIFSQEGDLQVTDSELFVGNEIRFQSMDLVALDTTDIEADFVEVSANNVDILLGSFSTEELKLNAIDDLRIEQLDLRTIIAISMAARTLVLTDIQFSSSSTIELGSANGLLAPAPNTGASAQTGYVNFIQNVTLDGSPAQDFVSSSQGGNATSSAAAIQIFSTLTD